MNNEPKVRKETSKGYQKPKIRILIHNGSKYLKEIYNILKQIDSKKFTHSKIKSIIGSGAFRSIMTGKQNRIELKNFINLKNLLIENISKSLLLRLYQKYNEIDYN